METPGPTKPLRKHDIAVSDAHVINVFMVAGDAPNTYVVFAMEWQSSEPQGNTASGKIAIGPDTYSTRTEADQRFDSIVQNWTP